MTAVTLRAGEGIQVTVRKHPLAVAVPLAVAALILALGFFLLVPLFSYGGFGVVAFCLLVGFAAFVAARAWVLWRSTVFLVTDQRVIDVDRTGLFRWTVSDVSYGNIADISYTIEGPLQVMLKAGNVLVMTGSGSNAIEARFVPDPGAVREAIVLHARGAMPEPTRAATDDDAAEDDDALEDDDKRALARYADSLKKRNAMRKFFDKGVGSRE